MNQQITAELFATQHQKITDLITESVRNSVLAEAAPTIIAVSKRHPEATIKAALKANIRVFGENQVQEAKQKWTSIKDTAKVELHLIGPLQSNKTLDAVALFDVIHTIDREKIARSVKAECDKQHKELLCFIQINTGDEPQKAGITPKDAAEFISLCRDEIGLNIIGLMCIPPANENPAPHFALLHKLAHENNVPELSMGMSGDYEIAAQLGATYVRVGTALFGGRVIKKHPSM